MAGSAEARIETPPLSVFLRPELHDDAFHGLAGAIARRLADGTGADPAPILLSALTMAGNAIGPQPHVAFGGAEHPARLFTVIVGDAASGRKGRAVNSVKRLFADADPDWYETRITEGLKSPEKMILRVDDDSSADCRLCIIEPEFARLARLLERTGFSAALRKAWDGVVLENSTLKRTLRASNAHISLIGLITRRELMRFHKQLSESGGLETRLLYCYSAPFSDVGPFDAENMVTDDLADQLHMALSASRMGVLEQADPISRHFLEERGVLPNAVLPLSDKVKDAWQTLVTDKLPRTDDEDLAGMWTRAQDQTVRLAAAYCALDASPMVEEDHIKAAVAVLSYCCDSARVLFGIDVAGGGTAVSRRARGKVVACLHAAAGGWVARDHLMTVVLSGHTRADDFDVLISDLKVTARVGEREVRDTGGRPMTQYRLPPPRPT